MSGEIPARDPAHHVIRIGHWVGSALLIAGLSGPVVAQEPNKIFDEGVAAYERADYAAAWFSFWSLAQRGDAAAQFNLSRLYHFGHGVEEDLGQARRWLEASARQGHSAAIFSLGQYYHLGLGGPVDLHAARALYETAAEAGYAPAQFNLALMHELGAGAPRDLATARRWYTRAAEQRLERARDALIRIGGAPIR